MKSDIWQYLFTHYNYS